jgi:hypothetical protein
MSSDGPSGRRKHPALHLWYHLLGQLNMASRGAAHYTLPATVNPSRFVQWCLGPLGMVNVACMLYSADKLY